MNIEDELSQERLTARKLKEQEEAKEAEQKKLQENERLRQNLVSLCREIFPEGSLSEIKSTRLRGVSEIDYIDHIRLSLGNNAGEWYLLPVSGNDSAIRVYAPMRDELGHPIILKLIGYASSSDDVPRLVDAYYSDK